MLIRLADLKNKTHHLFQEELEFEEDKLKKIDLLKKVKSLHGEATFEVCSPFIIVKLKLQGELILVSSHSLKDVPYTIDDEETLTFTLDKENEDDDVIYIEDNYLDLNPYFFALLNANIPFKVLGNDEEESIDGDSWELISEDEYYARKEKEDKTNPLFDALKDFDEE